MRTVKLHVVQYFKGDEKRTISKHLRREDALKYANSFIDNLIKKETEKGEDLIKGLVEHCSEKSEYTVIDLIYRKTNIPLKGVCLLNF